MRKPFNIAAIGVLALTAVQPLRAAPLIGFTDNEPSVATAGLLSDTTFNWAGSWTQTVATSSVTIRAILGSNVGPVPANWWITDAIGPGATAANVVFSGTYVAPTIATPFDFNGAPRTTLASGLAFAPGTYFLVFDGPAGQYSNNAEWYGGRVSNTTISLASGFALGDYYSGPAAPFAPSTAFNVVPQIALVFEMEGEFLGGVPEPEGWALLILGFGTLGAAVRRRNGRPAAGRVMRALVREGSSSA